VIRGYSSEVLILTGQCARCASPLVRREHIDSSLCRPCLRALDADVPSKRRILFSMAEAPGESLSTFA
jgi:hypothetical protein